MYPSLCVFFIIFPPRLSEEGKQKLQWAIRKLISFYHRERIQVNIENTPFIPKTPSYQRMRTKKNNLRFRWTQSMQLEWPAWLSSSVKGEIMLVDK